MNTGFPDAGTLRTVLTLASRDPSVHNTQPWRWRVFATRLAAIGVSAHNADQLDIVLAAAIPRRRTDRRHYSFWPVSVGDIALMARAAGNGVPLRPVCATDKLNEIVVQSVWNHATKPDYLAELTMWSGRYASVAGVPARNTPVSDSAAAMPSRMFAAQRWPCRPAPHPTRTTPHGCGPARSPASCSSPLPRWDWPAARSRANTGVACRGRRDRGGDGGLADRGCRDDVGGGWGPRTARSSTRHRVGARDQVPVRRWRSDQSALTMARPAFTDG